MRVYISGPITGKPNFLERFAAAEKIVLHQDKGGEDGKEKKTDKST